ncbi:MAG: putative toxin-antitoxin system toxin component, PIN family [Pseudomonadales bacterium]|nr:putative toxin-antitoxin system toxin component, PIN family [Pseudomonadales bacterium]
MAIHNNIASNMIIVIDTSVAVAALRSPMGASAEIMRRVLRGKIKAVASVPLFIEYEAVMLRPAHLKAARVSAKAVINLLDVLAGAVIPVEVFYLWRPQLKDADDDMVLEAAVNGQAGIIVTFNVSDFLPAAKKFAIRVLTPAKFLKELRDGYN